MYLSMHFYLIAALTRLEAIVRGQSLLAGTPFSQDTGSSGKDGRKSRYHKYIHI